MSEIFTKLKPKGATRKMINHFARNIYYIDLIDFSDKRDIFIKECIEANDKLKLKKNKNNNYSYVLICVDGYSRYIMYELLRKKTGYFVTEAMANIFKEHGKPNYICSDKGKEFLNKEFKNLLSKNNIKLYHGNSEQKSVYAEVMIKQIKNMIRKDYVNSNGVWIDYINDAINKINNSINSSINLKPVEVFKNNVIYTEEQEPNNLTVKDTTPQFKIGEHVRIRKIPSIFEKRSLNYNWSKKIYKITEIDDSVFPIMYSLDSKQKKYYHWQLLKSDQEIQEIQEPKVKEQRVYNTRNVKKDYSIYRYLKPRASN